MGEHPGGHRREHRREHLGGQAVGRIAAAVTACLLLLQQPAAARAPERRCGWLENPTPGNFWLRDRRGEWTVAIQGGYAAAGFDDNMGDMTTRGWVETNVHYGHGCACLDVVVDPASHRVLRLLAARPLPLATCRADRSLPRP